MAVEICEMFTKYEKTDNLFTFISMLSNFLANVSDDDKAQMTCLHCYLEIIITYPFLLSSTCFYG
jgi:hypothetical protein